MSLESSLGCSLRCAFACFCVVLSNTTDLRAQWTLMDPDPEILAYTNFLGQA